MLGKHSGRAALRTKLEQLGYTIGDNRLKVIFARFKNLADRKKEVFYDDLIALMQTTPKDTDDEFLRIKELRVVCGSESPREAAIVLSVGGEELKATSQGDGPVDAAFNAINSLFEHAAKLQLYQVQAVTERHGRPGDCQRKAGGKRKDRRRPVVRYRYRSRVREGLCQRFEQLGSPAKEVCARGGVRRLRADAANKVSPAKSLLAE